MNRLVGPLGWTRWLRWLTVVLALHGLLAAAQPAAPEPLRKSLTIDGLKVSYLQWGRDDAPTMLMIPGAGSVSATWATVAAAFAGDYRVLSFDYPGQGYSDWDPARRYSVMTHVALLKQAMAALNARRVIVVGHSQGGNEAVVYAAEDRDRVSALVALGGGYMMPGSTRAARRAEQARLGIAPPPPPATEFANWDDVRARVPGNASPLQARLETDNRYKQLPNGRIVSRNDPEQAAIAEADSMMQPGATEPFARRVTAPAMVARGGNDRSFERENAEMLASLLPDVKLMVTLPGAGHSAQRDKPDEFIAALRGFLSLTQPPARP